MFTTTRAPLILSFAISMALSVASAAAEGVGWKMSVQVDNDLVFGTDRDYTSGVRVAFVRDLDPSEEAHNFLQSSLYQASSFVARGFGGERRFATKPSRFSWGVGLTQLMYTAEDPELLTSPAGERPYAGWLGAEFSLNASDDDSVGGVTLSIGTTGEQSYAEEAQEWVHQNISHSPIFQGWDSQVSSELTVNLHFDQKEKIRFLDSTREWPIQFDGYYEGGLALGNFRTNTYLGLLVRGGLNLPSHYATPRVQLGSYGHALFVPDDTGDHPFSIYAFGGIRGSAVLHDITLDGPVFRDYDGAVDSEPFMGESIVGFAVHFHGLSCSVSQTIRTREFEGQSESQAFGSVMLRAGFRW